MILNTDSCEIQVNMRDWLWCGRRGHSYRHEDRHTRTTSSTLLEIINMPSVKFTGQGKWSQWRSCERPSRACSVSRIRVEQLQGIMISDISMPSDYHTTGTKRAPRAETGLNFLDIIPSTLVSTGEEPDCVYHAQRNGLTMSSVYQIANKLNTAQTPCRNLVRY